MTLEKFKKFIEKETVVATIARTGKISTKAFKRVKGLLSTKNVKPYDAR